MHEDYLQLLIHQSNTITMIKKIIDSDFIYIKGVDKEYENNGNFPAPEIMNKVRDLLKSELVQLRKKFREM